jgi:Ca-activated chloride channel family protein
MSVMHATRPSTAPDASTGGRLVTPDGRTLPFLGGDLSVDAKGGLARVTLRQRFHNPYDEPLRVTYQVPLPSDAAVSGYAFELPTERIEGQVDTKQKARARFEEAIIEGRSAALLEQERSSLFTQEVGNIPPHSTVVCELRLDQLLSWEGRAGGWSWRFPTVVAPRYQGEAGRVPDTAKQTVDVAAQGTAARMGLRIAVRDTCTGALQSPTHRLHVVGAEATLQEEGGVALDRDIVVQWPVAAPTPGVDIDLGRAGADRSVSDHACGLLTLVPPVTPGQPVARDLVVLLDTSGSMAGAPLQQAKDVTAALVESLGDGDQLQIIEFSVRPRAWKSAPIRATGSAKRDAKAWLAGLRAGGGTEMKSGILAALETLRGEAQRQVVLVTDGLIGFEREITGAVMHRLPRGCRVHTVGIGSGVNRSLLTPVARAGGGIEVIVGLDESADAAAAALVRATAAPQVVDLELGGDALLAVDHHNPPDLMGGRPSRLALRLKPMGGTLTVRGRTHEGPWQATLTVPPLGTGEGSPAVVSLVGRERAEELELKAAMGAQVDGDLEAIGIGYQISTRRTSWVAVSQALTVDPTAPTRSERVPQALPHGMSAEGIGLRPAMAAMPDAAAGAPPMLMKRRAAMAPPPPSRPAPARAGSSRTRSRAPKKAKGVFQRVAEFFSSEPETAAESAAPPPPASMPAPMEREEAASTGKLEGSFGGGGLPPAPEASDADDAFADEDLPPLADEATLAEEELEEEVEEEVDLDLALSLPARLILGKGDRLVVEVVLPQDLGWDFVGRTVEVHASRGPVLRATVDATRTTRPGTIPAGATLRLTLLGPNLGQLPYPVRTIHLTASASGGPAMTLSL